MTTRQLILLSNEYPSETGDFTFIQSEAPALSDAFDEILVYSYNPVPVVSPTMPANFRYMGALPATNRFAGLLALINPRNVRQALKVWQYERSSGRIPSWMSIYTGLRFAKRIGITEPSDTRTTVYCFWATNSALAIPFLRRKGRTVVRAHGYDLYEERNNHLPFRSAIFGTPMIIAPISNAGAEYLKHKYPSVVDPARIHVRRLGTKDHGLGAATPNAGPLRILSCSRLIDLKRVPAILEAAAIVSRQCPVEWTHIGGDPAPAFAELKRATHEVQQHAPNLRVNLLGQLHPSQVIDHFSKNPVDVFVNASTTEGVPVSIMESLSFDVPVVATDVGGTGELFASTAASAGVLLSPEESTAEASAQLPERLAAAVRYIADNRSEFSPRKVWEALADARQTSALLVQLLTEA